MDAKIYFLFVLFSTIIASSSHTNLREYMRKLRFARLWKARLRHRA